MKKLMVVITVIACLFTSCATTMQQDVFQTSDLNKELMEEVSIFEDRCKYLVSFLEYILCNFVILINREILPHYGF